MQVARLGVSAQDTELVPKSQEWGGHFVMVNDIFFGSQQWFPIIRVWQLDLAGSILTSLRVASSAMITTSLVGRI